jgi:phytoene synthase
MEGSAAVIGTMMLPVLGSPHPGGAREPARQLGLAFQLTNFIRDVTEDLARDRVYLPQEDLRRFGVTEDDLRRGVTTPPVRQLVAHEVARARRHYALAAPGIALLAPAAQPCIRAAYRLYGGILDEIVAGGYDVLGQRATVPAGRRLRVAAGCLFARPGRPVPLPGVAADGRTSSRV